MTKKDLLDSIEYLLEAINTLISKGPSEKDQIVLDDLADKLDSAQNRLAKLIIQENDTKFVELAKQLDEVNSQIKHDLTELEKFKEILDGVKQAVKLITEIVELFMVAAGKV